MYVIINILTQCFNQVTTLLAHRKKYPTYDELAVVETYTADCKNMSLSYVLMVDCYSYVEICNTTDETTGTLISRYGH
jgi:hypothetical protein